MITNHLHKILAFCLLAALLAVGCTATPTSTVAADPENAPAGEVVAGAAEEVQGEPAGEPNAEPAANEALRGPGAFDLTEPAAGLDQLSHYSAVLSLSFDGTQQGNPYVVKETYRLSVDQDQDARFLTIESTDAAGNTVNTFTGKASAVRYTQGAADQPCHASLASSDQQAVFEPARLLPHLLGAEEAGQEAVGSTNATVYQFDRLALGVGEEAAAAGKVWIAQEGGWVVKYELSLQSDVVFGNGISGEQRWSYEVSDIGTAEMLLPAACPPVFGDFPMPQESSGITRLPGKLQYQVNMTADALAAFYEEQLLAQGWTKQGDAVPASGDARWLYSKPADGKELVTLITALPEGDKLAVTILQVTTDPPPPPAQ